MKSINRYVILSMISLFFLYACKDDKVDCTTFHWGYEGESGPEHWAECSEDCGGETQSPININGAVTDNTLVSFSSNYDSTGIHIINNGHTLEFKYEEGFIVFQGVTYGVLQFHYHAPSEHTIAGQHFPLELHIVHKNESTGNLAVIGILLEIGNENPFIQRFINNLPDETNEVYQSPAKIHLNELLPADRHYYTYSGSLTTPPCSEIVSWIVLQTPVSISASQLERFTDNIEDNNRTVQTLNGRVIREPI